MIYCNACKTFHRSPGGKPQPTNRRTKCSIFAEAEGLLGSNENVDAALLKKCRNCVPHQRSPSAMTILSRCAYRPKNSADAHTNRINRTVADTLMALVLSTARRVVEVQNG